MPKGIEERLAACRKQLEAVDDDITKAKKALAEAPDSDTKERMLLLRAWIELKSRLLEDKARVEAEKRRVTNEADVKTCTD